MRQMSPELRVQRANEIGLIVDPENYYLLEQYTWYIESDGYPRTTRINADGVKKRYHLHQLVAGFTFADETIDHINRNKLDNRQSNLRRCSLSTNVLNCDKNDIDDWIHIHEARYGKYEVRICRDGQRNYLGRFETVEQARATRNQWLKEHGYI